MTPRRRLDMLESTYYRHMCSQVKPATYTTDAFIEAAIHWLEMPPEQQQARMPDFTAAELDAIKEKLLVPLKRARMAGR